MSRNACSAADCITSSHAIVAVDAVHLLERLVDVGRRRDEGRPRRHDAGARDPVERIAPGVARVAGAPRLLQHLEKMPGSPEVLLVARPAREQRNPWRSARRR